MLRFDFKINLILVLISIFIVLIIINNSLCFKVPPYGFMNEYSSLPINKKFCIYDDSTDVNFITNNNGARVFKEATKIKNLKIFGDSQVLGLDISLEKNHFLKKLFSDYNLKLFAAPNNGPYEVLKSIELNTENNELIIINFNSSTDIHRINEYWNFKKNVTISNNHANFLANFPVLFDFISFINFYSNSDKPKLLNNYHMQDIFLNYENEEILKNFNLFFEKLRPILKAKNLNYEFFFTHPYWIYDRRGQKLSINMKVYEKYNKLEKILMQEYPFIRFSKIKNRDIGLNNLTFDKRHLRSNQFTFD